MSVKSSKLFCCRRPWAITIILLVMLTGIAAEDALAKPELYQFKLVGGHFFGPGPIVPDTALPVGYLRNIQFDLTTFSGHAKFVNDGSKRALLSDGKTPINQNIDAGVLDIGGGENPVLLVAVKGGRNKGREYYRLAEDYSFVWSVDIALDPGFAEGIIRVENFLLTTGIVKIALSAQTEQGIPGGYDQAGSLQSGQYLAGRVGDFNQDGFMDGIVVAAPRVPLESAMLPGAPVGNQRGFETDVPLPAHLAGELTLRGIAQFEGPLTEMQTNGDSKDAAKLWQDISARIDAALANIHQAVNSGAWKDPALRRDGLAIAEGIKSWKEKHLAAISLPRLNPENSPRSPTAFTATLSSAHNTTNTTITTNSNTTSADTTNTTTKVTNNTNSNFNYSTNRILLFFNDLDPILEEIKSLNAKTAQQLPERTSKPPHQIQATKSPM